MSLRDLFIGVDFDVNEKELRKGDDAVNDLTKETKKAGSEMKTLDKNSKKAGSSIGNMAKKIGAIVGIYEIGRAFKFAGQEALDYYDIARILTKVTGRLIQYSKPGFLKYRRHMIKHRNLDKKYVNVTVALYFMTRMGTAKGVTQEFFELTGKKPRTFETFARDNREAFMPKEMIND
jgi:hypothetical protein